MVMAWKLSKCLNAFDRISQQAMEVMDVHWQAHVILLEYERNFHLSNVDDQRVSFSRTGRSDISFRSCANTVSVLAFFITADTRSITPSSCGWFEIHFLTARLILWDPQPISGIFNKEAMQLCTMPFSPTKHIMLYSVLPSYVHITWAKWCKWSWAVIPSTSSGNSGRMDNNACLISSTPYC